MKKFILKTDEVIRKLIPQDRALHFIGGTLVMFVVSLILFALKASFPVALVISLVVTFLAGTYKECYINYAWKGEEAEFGDIMSTTLGGVLVAAVEAVMFYFGSYIVVY